MAPCLISPASHHEARRDPGIDKGSGRGYSGVNLGNGMTKSSSPTDKEWKEAVIDALVCDFILDETNANNPRKAIHDIISWNVQLATDPLVSDHLPADPTDEDFIALAAQHCLTYERPDGVCCYPMQDGYDMRDDLLRFVRIVYLRGKMAQQKVQRFPDKCRIGKNKA
jgi:hypothetical protein